MMKRLRQGRRALTTTFFGGLRYLRRGEAAPRALSLPAANDTIRDELEEFAACIRKPPQA